MGIVEKLKSLDKKHLFILLLIFLLGFGIRAHLMKYELFFEFDSYWHARMTEQILVNGKAIGFNETDPQSYYQLGGGPMSYSNVLWWYISAAFYKVFSIPFTGGAYDKALWIEFVKFLPAFFGALTALAMFLFFNVMYGRRAGYLAGFFTAVSSAFIYRSMAGFFEGSAGIFFFMVMGFYFIAKAVKRPELKKANLLNVVLGGVFLGLTSWIGGWYLISPYIILAYGIAMTVILFFRNQPAKPFAVIFCIALLSFAIVSWPQPEHPGLAWFQATVDYLQPFINPQRFETTGPVTGDIGAVFRQSVGEQSKGITFFGNKYNALIVFPILAIVLIPWRLFRNKKDSAGLLVFFWVFSTFVMAWNRLQLTYAFGLAVAAAAAFVCFNIFELLKQRTSLEKKTIVLAIGFMMLIGVASATIFTSSNVPNIESDAGWKDALKWLRENTPKDAKIFNWWDEGHWISFIGERKVLIDNRNIDLDADSNVALFVVTEDVNKACKIVHDYGSDYMLLGDDLLVKQFSLAMYAYKTTDPYNPGVQKSLGGASVLNCSKNVSQAGTSYACRSSDFGLQLSEEQMKNINTTWTSKFSQMLNERTPVFIYRDQDNSTLYILTPGINSSMIARLWFNDPEASCAEYVFGKQAKIFKVK